VVVGEVLRVDDVVTGFDDNKRGRPCMVVRVSEAPRAGAWVVPRSKKGSQGTLMHAGVLPGLDRDGRFMFLPRFVPAADLTDCESLGVLPDHIRDLVLASIHRGEAEERLIVGLAGSAAVW
jgi:hypothetical protein